MLEIKNITKDYDTGTDEKVHALRGVSVNFRDCELVAILGHSGCGKTTLLNIIGGLDQYTSGDLSINGRSTKQYKSRDWDAYRNHSVGFIFQSYNLIPHQTVLSNVELALTLSGVSKAERRRRAVEALVKVGLGDQLNKRPNQMSGGQMQRVAIARALVNNPDILLADEPTGALDSETSVQIMELIKEIAKDRLVIMVTHNPDLANDYATRIVRLVDGKITADSDPYEPGEEEKKPEKSSVKSKEKKPSMGFGTALALSFKNLLTKKGRTFLTAFAGSIGIIGIALILSLSNGVQLYINSVEHSTLASYPISIQQETVDYTSLMESMMGIAEEDTSSRDPDKIYTNSIATQMLESMLSEIQTNNLAAFKEYIEENPDNIMDNISEIKYSYSSSLYVYGNDINNEPIQVNPSTVMNAMMGDNLASTMGQVQGIQSTFMGGNSMASSMNVWEEMLGNDIIRDQYKVLAGKFPESYDEVAVLVNDRNEISDMVLYSIGLLDQSELDGLMEKIIAGEEVKFDSEKQAFSYDDLMNLSFKLMIPSDFYKKNDEGKYEDMRKDTEFMKSAMENAPAIKVVGILKPDDDSLINSSNSGGIGYTHALTEFMINRVNDSELVKNQKENPDVDVFTGIEFPKKDEKPDEPMSQEKAMQQLMSFMTPEQLTSMMTELMGTLTPEQQGQVMSAAPEQQMNVLFSMADQSKITVAFMNVITAEQMQQLQQMTQKPETTEASYDGNLTLLGVADLQKPSGISIYAKDFDSKEIVTKFISDYNDKMIAQDKQEDAINYTDYVGLMISSVSTIINAISYILIAFVAISLVVSSIMIGIITYISVLERTKEIGILRAMGASKSNVSNVFNAETLIVGFSAGAIGVLVTILLNIPINVIIKHLTDIDNMSQLPWQGGVILVIISMLLTLIAGLFPASVAAKKDPVEALRTE